MWRSYDLHFCFELFLIMLQEIENIDDLMKDDMLDNIIPVDKNDAADIEPLITIDLDEVDATALDKANVITERLSNYYFDERYIKEHPYIPTKIMLEMDNIRRLLKMLMVNEKAQDALIRAVALSPGKGTLFISLTSMQRGTLLIQKQLNDIVTGLEQIFQRMQDEADKQWTEKDKETDDDGTITVRGSREFIKQLQEEFYKKHNVETKEEVTDDVNITTGVNADGTPEGATPLSDIIG